MHFQKHAVVAVLAVIGIVLFACKAERDSDNLPVNANILAEQPGGLTWYRGNLHTHTLWSDGDDYPEMVADWYRRHGYNFLAFTEHNTLQSGQRWIDVLDSAGGLIAFDKLKARFPPARIDEREVLGRTQTRLKQFGELSAELTEPGRFLLLQGEEVSDAHASTSIHLGAINLAEYLPPAGGSNVLAVMQRDVDELSAQSRRRGQPMLAYINHPNFLNSLTAEDIMRVSGAEFFEIYNGHPLSHNNGDGNRPSTERLWDIVLTYRIAALGLPLMYGLANDDSHQYHHIPSGRSEPGRGWVMVLADALSPASLITALENGRFYASTGVTLARVVHSGAAIQVDVDAEPGVDYLIEFIGTRQGFDPGSRPARSRTGREIYATRRYSNDIGATLAKIYGASGRYVFDPDDLYVRARVTASRRHPNPSQPFQFEQAWVQPVPGPAGSGGAPNRPIAAPKSARAELHGELASGFSRLPATIAAALLANTTADCSLDRIVDQTGVPGTTSPGGSKAQFGGWISDRTQPTAPDAISLVLRGENDYLAEGINGANRPDVAAALGNSAFERAGFNLDIALAGLPPDNYSIILVAHYADDSRACDSGKRLAVQ